MTDLVQRLRQYAAGMTGFEPILTEAADRIEQLERENAELRKDAERYRWILSGPSFYGRFAHVYDGWDGSDGKEGFDASIDEAMK